jgi:hypothetical protein
MIKIYGSIFPLITHVKVERWMPSENQISAQSVVIYDDGVVTQAAGPDSKA